MNKQMNNALVTVMAGCVLMVLLEVCYLINQKKSTFLICINPNFIK